MIAFHPIIAYTSNWHMISEQTLVCINTFSLQTNIYNAILRHDYRHS